MPVWDDLVGQEKVSGQLGAAARDADALVTAVAADTPLPESSKMTHAWLFTGPPGSGRADAARAFAAALQCVSPDRALGGEPGCGFCDGCHTSLIGTHADVEVIRTDLLSIGVKETRDLVRRAQMSPAGGRWQVIVGQLEQIVVQLEQGGKVAPELLAHAICQAIALGAEFLAGIPEGLRDRPGVHRIRAVGDPALDVVDPHRPHPVRERRILPGNGASLSAPRSTTHRGIAMAESVKDSIDITERKGVVGSGYIPKVDQTSCTANSKGLFAYYRVAETGFVLTCRMPDGSGSGWSGITGIKDIRMIDAKALSLVHVAPESVE